MKRLTRICNGLAYVCVIHLNKNFISKLELLQIKIRLNYNQKYRNGYSISCVFSFSWYDWFFLLQDVLKYQTQQFEAIKEIAKTKTSDSSFQKLASESTLLTQRLVSFLLHPFRILILQSFLCHKTEIRIWRRSVVFISLVVFRSVLHVISRSKVLSCTFNCRKSLLWLIFAASETWLFLRFLVRQ